MVLTHYFTADKGCSRQGCAEGDNSWPLGVEALTPALNQLLSGISIGYKRLLPAAEEIHDLVPRIVRNPRRRGRLIVLGSQPLNADIGVAAEKHDQLTGVVLGVSQVVQQELADVQLVPREPAALEGPFVSQPLEGFVALPQAVIGVVK